MVIVYLEGAVIESKEKLAVGSRQFAVKAKTSFFARQAAVFKVPDRGSVNPPPSGGEDMMLC